MSGWGKLLYHLLPFRRRMILDNIRQVYGPDFPRARELAQAFYDHFVTSMWEFVAQRFWSDKLVRRKIEIRGAEHVLAASDQKKGILVFTCHLGSWEFAPAAALLHFPQYRGKFHFIRKALQPDILQRLVFSTSHNAGVRILPRRASLDRILELLERNEVVVFLMDQHARQGIPVEFFGRKAKTSRSLALIAAYTGAPVIPATSWREPDGRHVMEFHRPLEWISAKDPEEEIEKNTRRYNECLERFILAHPEQWWWVHRRWKLD